MRSRYRILERNHSHFITATTVAWLPIFTTAARCDILVDAFEYCRQHKALKIYAWSSSTPISTPSSPRQNLPAFWLT